MFFRHCPTSPFYYAVSAYITIVLNFKVNHLISEVVISWKVAYAIPLFFFLSKEARGYVPNLLVCFTRVAGALVLAGARMRTLVTPKSNRPCLLDRWLQRYVIRVVRYVRSDTYVRTYHDMNSPSRITVYPRTLRKSPYANSEDLVLLKNFDDSRRRRARARVFTSIILELFSLCFIN